MVNTDGRYAKNRGYTGKASEKQPAKALNRRKDTLAPIDTVIIPHHPVALGCVYSIASSGRFLPNGEERPATSLSAGRGSLSKGFSMWPWSSLSVHTGHETHYKLDSRCCLYSGGLTGLTPFESGRQIGLRPAPKTKSMLPVIDVCCAGPPLLHSIFPRGI
jgi:hypothetical protein